MIIGNGLLASACRARFKDVEDLIIFASGVSNSREERSEEFLREKNMLIDALSYGKFLIYFSSCSVNDLTLMKSAYVTHKLAMEALVGSAENHAIFRLPQVVGKTANPHTLTNYLYNVIISGAHFQIWRNAARNLIDVDDIVTIIEHLYCTSKINRVTMNIACPFSIPMVQLVSVFESILDKKANFTLIDAGGSYTIDTDLATATAKQIGIDFDDSYIERLIRKYYVSQ